ncbi:hypothetical protein FH609_002435 [Streptomyces sp. 3MP-14]|uniref:Uncharacterized protein n=1 Tax=Streptomyces mimosae TaxID=2586635 RepID=A0A5N6ARQ5_9ACTN|nr:MULTISPECIES: protein DpdG [Streptomyces]KAB8170792.1 hypothetical protein FH607_000035 [Streptomyces mimosae]KAB8179855.1 hypothetical protein FH609_002435 [Streptomyces sp. 3MP-14]
MTLLNVEAALPSQTWALVRLLLSLKKSIPLDDAEAFVSPPSVVPPDKKSASAFRAAVSTLRMLGLIHVDGDRNELSLAGRATTLDSCDELVAYTTVLRNAVFDADLNSDLGANDSFVGPRDLTRALAWFLTHDPTEPAIDGVEAEHLIDARDGKDRGSLKPEVLPLFPNRTRWIRLNHWAPFLGLAAAPLFPRGGSAPMLPDCTAAVRQTVAEQWPLGRRVNAVEALRAIRSALPVLPGGAHSLAIGIVSPGENVAGPTLSFALLRGHDEGWLRLDHDDDAPHPLRVYDADRPTSARTISDITILEAAHG